MFVKGNLAVFAGTFVLMSWRIDEFTRWLSSPTAYALILVASLGGWGALLNRLVLPGRHVDFGLRCCWGMALLTFLGGLGLLLHLAARGTLLGIVFLGVLFAYYDFVAARMRPASSPALRPSHPPDLVFRVGAAVVVAFLVLRLAAISHREPVVNRNDDPPAYWAFIEQVLQSGTVDQPFSLRGLLSYGGQTFFQALTVAGVPIDDLSIWDAGICPLLLVLLIAGHRTPRAMPRGVLLAPMLVVAFSGPVYRNSTSVYSAALVLLAFFRTMSMLPMHRRARRTTAILLGLLTICATTLRPTYGMVAGLAIALGYAFSARRRLARALARRRPLAFDRTLLVEASRVLRTELREAAWLTGCCLLFVAPWALASFMEFRTPLFPLFRGTYYAGAASFGMTTPLLDRLTWLARLPFANMFVTGLWPFFVAAFCVPDRRTRRPLHAFLIASVATSISMALVMHENTGRYGYPHELAACLAIAIAAASTDLREVRGYVGAALAMVAIMIQLQALAPPALPNYAGFVDQVRGGVWRRVPDNSLAALQSRAPEGAAILSMTENAFELDFKRNPIFLIDMPGMVSPSPGLPLAEGPNAVVDYLLDKSIRYVIFGPEAGLYDVNQWRTVSGDPNVDPPAAHAPFFLRASAVFEEIAATRKTLASAGDTQLIDLATRN